MAAFPQPFCDIVRLRVFDYQAFICIICIFIDEYNAHPCLIIGRTFYYTL